jgi:HAD superfamily hydrolase (TIGR01509 family)
MARAPKELWPYTAQAAIFDFDGTLADTAHIWNDVDRTFLGRRNLAVPADYPERLAALGFEEGARYTIDRFSLDETVDEIMAEWTELSQEIYQHKVRLRPGVLHYIEALSDAGVPVALATTNLEEVLSQMEHISVKTLFDACVFGTDVSRGKDFPDIFLEAATRLGCDPASCVVFEDNLSAVRSAQSLRMRCVAVRAEDATQHADELRSQADLWLDDWRDIDLG